VTDAAGDAIPSGVVAFLFTDVEGSTALWAADAAAMSASLQVHDEIVRAGIEGRGGYIFATAGDAYCASFQRASDAVAAAEQIQSTLGQAVWPGPPLRVRIGVHLGESEERGGDYFGPTVNTAARVETAGHGGQILITDPVRTAAALVGALDLGEHSLKDLPGKVEIFQIGDRTFPPLRTADGRGSNLPTMPNRLVGREDDVRDIRLLLAEHRLVTLMAVGGIGKTRLAIEVADQELPHWRDGVWFVDLTQASTDSDVARAVARSIGLEIQDGDMSARVATFVAGQSMLIVLDNCEHLIDACAGIVQAVLAAGGSSKVLATSREWLDIDFEQVFQVHSLDTSGDDNSAVQLFVRRARATDPDFTADTDGVVAEVCRRLDGMPLAIELAAARVTVLSPVALLDGLDDRFRLLSGGRRRQRGRTLKATIDWSYELLADDEQRFFRRLGVFLGSFDIAAAATVADTSVGEATDIIEALFARSLVARSPEWPGRFNLLETLKAYAEDRLVDVGEAQDTRERLHRHFAPTATLTLVINLMTVTRVVALEPDQANIAQITDWLENGERWNELADFLLHTCHTYSRNPAHTLGVLERTRSHIVKPGIDAELAQAQIVTAMLASDWRTYVRTCFEELGHDDTHYAGLAHLLMSMPIAVSDMEGALAHVERFVELPSRLDADTKHFHEMANRAIVCCLGGDTVSARRHAEATLAIIRHLETDHFSAIAVLQILGVFASADGDRASLTRLVGDIRGVAGTTTDPFLRSFGDFVATLDAASERGEAREPVRQYLRRCATGQVAQGESDAIVVLAAICGAEGEPEYARDLLMSPINPRSPASHLALNLLATQLGVGDEVRKTRRTYVADGSSLNLDLPKQTLRAELERRGWLN